MKSAKLERMLLHSFATSTANPGNSNTKRSRKTGTPSMWNSWQAIAEVPTCSKYMSLFSATVGSGTISRRNKRGKVSLPQNSPAEATNESSDD